MPLWLLTPIARKVGLAVVGLALLFAAYRFAYNRGNAAGYSEGQRTQLDLDKQSFQQDRKQFLDTLSAAQRINDAAQQKISQQDSELAAIKSRRDANRKAIAALPDEKLLPDIRSRIGGGSSNSPLTADELRLVSTKLSDLDSVQEQVNLLEAKSEQQDIRISAVEKQRDSAILYGNQVTAYYVKAYAAAQKKPNWFMRLFHIKGKHLNLPDPVTLKGN